MSIKYNYRGLIDNDVVVLRNGDKGIVFDKSIILQSGEVLRKKDYKYSNKAIDTNYDIIKIYHNYESELVSFNIACDEKNLVWKEEISFPELKNGDVVILNNDSIYMKVDDSFVSPDGGYVIASRYDANGKNCNGLSNDYEWNIKKVYRNNDELVKYYFFGVVKDEWNLIWERH